MPNIAELGQSARMTTEELIQALKSGDRSFSLAKKAPAAKPWANDFIRKLADDYAAEKGLPTLQHGLPLSDVDQGRASRIAEAYDSLKHDPDHPQVKSAYDALIKETMDQYQKLKNSGLKIEKITPDMENPYKGGSHSMLSDVKDNNHMWYFPTEQGFGTGAKTSNHPLLQMTEELGPDGKPMPANDIFRIVHDYFGHAKEGNGFGPKGEEQAWRSHMQMFTPEAQKALTTETRGQNSWVNYGPKGEANRANPSKTVYADQKAGLLPDWAMEHNDQHGGWSKFDTAEGPRYVVYDTGETPAYHMSKQPLEELDPAFQGTGTDSMKFMRTGKPQTPYSSVYKMEQEPEDIVKSRSGNVRNIVNVNPSLMYDIAKDPENYIAKAQHDLAHGNFEGNPINAEDLARTRIKSAGWNGLQRQSGYELFQKAPAMVGAFGATLPKGTSPLEYMRNAFDTYEDVKNNLTGKLAKQMVPDQMPNTMEGAADNTRGAIQSMANVVADPMNIVPGPVGAGLAAGSMMSQMAPKAKGGNVEAMAEGGMAGSAELPPGFEIQPQQPNMPTEHMPSPDSDGGELPEGFVTNDELYGSPGQMALTALEGASQGVAGPIAPWVEKHVFHGDEKAMLARRETNPLTFGIGEAAGLAGSALTGVGAAPLLEHAGQAALGAVGLAGDLSKASLLTKAAASAVSQAVQTSIIEGSDQVSKMVLNDPETSAQTAVVSSGLAGLIGGGAGAFMTGVVHPLFKLGGGKKLSQALEAGVSDFKHAAESGTPDYQMKPFLKKVLSTYGGVTDKDIDEYLAHHKAIQDLPEWEQIYDKIMDHVTTISDSVRDSGLTYAHEHETYKELEDEMKSLFVQKGFEASLSDKLAKTAMKTAQTQLATNVQETALHAAPRIALAAEALRNSVIEGSSKAYDVLADSKAIIPLKGFNAHAVNLAHELEAEGTLEGKQQAERLREYIANVNKLKADKISGVEAKELIQGLDKVSKYDFNATTFDKGMSRSYKALRNTLDTTLKDAVPEYKAAMKPVAEETGLLASLGKYGTDTDAIRSVKGLTNPAKFKTDWSMLEKLEEKTGVRFLDDIKSYADPKVKASLMKSLPEYGEAEHAASVLQHLKNPATRAAMEAELEASPQALRMRQAEQAMTQAQEQQSALKGITPMTLQSKLNTVARGGKNIALEKQMAEHLPLINGKTVPELMNLMRMKEVFEKDATRGSKHVNLFGTLLAGAGELAGFKMGGLYGAGVGAGAGAYVDKNGPAMVKRLLDKYVEHFGDVGKLAKEGQPGAARRMMQALVMAGPDHGVSADGFKSGVDFISAVERGEKALSRGAAAVFITGAPALSPAAMPSHVDRLKLDKLVAQNQQQPDNFAEKQQDGSKLGHYLPGPQTAVTETATRAQQYLASLKPTEKRASPLDRPIPPSPEQFARYDRALNIAINPAVIFQHIKSGTLQRTDLVDLKSMYPQLYPAMVNKMADAMQHAIGKGENVPYQTRIGLSLFMGQPLDSTMLPQNILAAQPKPQQQPAPFQGKAGSTKSLNKSNRLYQTPGQEAEKDRSTRD